MCLSKMILYQYVHIINIDGIIPYNQHYYWFDTMMAFRGLFDLLGSREMMTLDSHFKHLFLKKDLVQKRLGLSKC
jgi:hypothetical protein